MPRLAENGPSVVPELRSRLNSIQPVKLTKPSDLRQRPRRVGRACTLFLFALKKHPPSIGPCINLVLRIILILITIVITEITAVYTDLESLSCIPFI